MDRLEKGMRVWVAFGKQKEAGILLDFEGMKTVGNYQRCKVELLKANPLSAGQLLRQTYPHPVQSYKLTKRYCALEGEVQA